MGLTDVTKWTSRSLIQVFLDSNQWVVFVARPLVPVMPPEDLIGIIAGGLEEEGRIWIELMVVSSTQRRKGIGTALVHKLEEFGRDSRARALFVDLDDDNYSALDFYRAVGFDDAGVIKQYYYDGTDALVMVKPLRDE